MANDVKWIKITTDIFDDEKIMLIESLPSGDSILVIWFKLLVFAGKQNNSGIFLMPNKIPYTEEMLATIFRRDLNLIRTAITTFQQFEMIEVVNDVITIPKWDKHQSLTAWESKKAYDREYQAKKRLEKQEKAGLLENRTINRTTSYSDRAEIVPPDIRYKTIDTRYPDNRYLDTKEQSINTTTTTNNTNTNTGGDGGDSEPDQPNLDTVEAYVTNNLCIMNSSAYEELVGYLEILPGEMIKYAVDEANAHGSRQWAYVRNMIKRWLDKDIKTLADAKANDEAFRKAKNKPETPTTDFERAKWIKRGD